MGHRERRSNLANAEELPLDKPRILDLGCGTGWFTERFTTIGEPTGFELNVEAMKAASNRLPHIRFAGGYFFEYPLNVQEFDILVSMQVIAHVDDQAAFIDQAARVLRLGVIC